MELQKEKSKRILFKPKTTEEVVHEYYLEYSKLMKEKHGWASDEGVFLSVIKFMINSDMITMMSIMKIHKDIVDGK